VASDFQSPEMAFDTSKHRVRQGEVAKSRFKIEEETPQVDSEVLDGYHFHFTNIKLCLEHCNV